MHRNDWLPQATFVTYEDWTATPTLACPGTVTVRKHFATMTHPEQDFVRHNGGVFVGKRGGGIEYEGAGVYLLKQPCVFVAGHPGVCGTRLPDIFLPDGRVKPQIERLLRNRRNPHGTVDPAPDRRPDHTSPT